MSNHVTGDPVEADFIESWDTLGVVFEWMLARVPWKDLVFQFITQLRQAGYDRKIRAGQSLELFIVSRSRNHGLRPDQPRVIFCFHDDVMDVLEGDEPTVRNTDIFLSGPVQAALARLLSRDIE